MRISEAFLVNTKNFDTIINALVSSGELPIDTDLIEKLGYSDPNDLLVINLLRDLKVINQDGSAGKYFEEFQDPETTKAALAKGLLTAYEQLFENYPNIHQSSPEKIKESFEELLRDKKTDLIIKYITGTFLSIVSYCRPPTINAVQKGNSSDDKARNISIAKNGNHKNGKTSIEETGEKAIDDLMIDFEVEMLKKDKLTNNQKFNEVPAALNKKKAEEKDANNSFNSFDKKPGTNPIINGKSYSIDSIDSDPFDLKMPMSEVTQTLNGTNKNQFIQKALFRKSELLNKMQQWENLLSTLEEIINRYDNKAHADLKEGVSRSIIHRALVLLKLERIQEALPALDTVINRFKDSSHKEFYQKASMAMLYKAQILEHNENGELLPLYNAIIERMDSTSDGTVKDKLDQIHMKRFDLIIADGEPAKILDASSKLINRFKDKSEHPQYLRKAMIQRAEILDQMNRDEDALEAYDDFLVAFG